MQVNFLKCKSFFTLEYLWKLIHSIEILSSIDRIENSVSNLGRVGQKKNFNHNDIKLPVWLFLFYFCHTDLFMGLFSFFFFSLLKSPEYWKFREPQNIYKMTILKCWFSYLDEQLFLFSRIRNLIEAHINHIQSGIY